MLFGGAVFDSLIYSVSHSSQKHMSCHQFNGRMFGTLFSSRMFGKPCNARVMNGYAVPSSAVRNRGDGRCCGGGESDGGKPADVTVTTE